MHCLALGSNNLSKANKKTAYIIKHSHENKVAQTYHAAGLVTAERSCCS
jgi:hypothetical protein